MAEVACVYSLEPVPRSPDDVLRELHRAGPWLPRPRPLNKRVWASVARPLHDVMDEAFLEALQRDPDRLRTWAAVVDGNEEQIRWLHRLARNIKVNLVIILDFIHVLGYLWKAGKVLAGPDKVAIEEWVEVRARRLLNGKVSGVAAGMRRAATARKLDAETRGPVDACANYLLKYKKYLRYDEYLRKGLPIASGVIEGACRSLVRDRMDITGARWGLASAEAVLELRALRASGDLGQYLDYHFARERERNHLSQFGPEVLLHLRAA